MARYPLNLPQQLKQEAEMWAKRQGVSLNQFILWATAEKVGALNQQLDDPDFPQITYRRGASGIPVPVIRGTGIRVQTIVIAHQEWQMTGAEIALEYGLAKNQIDEALAFYNAHQAEVDGLLSLEEDLAKSRNG
ncbi:MAG: DUF433 domain-containing protein [Ardenticatenaceae bacterium]|nr:DUF433 domain-containing protein [Ardenticatenaceae bacterium]